MSENDLYAPLMAQLGYPDSERMRALLKNMMNEEEAAIVGALPGTVEDTAKKVGKDTEVVRKILDKLFYDGVVAPRGDFNNRDFYNFARHGVGLFHDATQASKMRDPVKDAEFYGLWQDFVMNDWYPDTGKAMAAAPTPRSRIVPAYKSVQHLPEFSPQDDYRELLKAQDMIAVVPCSCRYRTASVGEPCDYCAEEERFNCLLFNRNAEYAVARGSGNKLSIEEALELCDKVEEDGLLHIWPNADVMGGVPVSCQCCRDCCMIYVPMDMAEASIGKVWEKSRFEAVVDQDKCDGCQDCVDRCQFDAIEMVRIKTATTKKGKKGKLKSTINPDNCWGCGVCVLACEETNALTMKAVRPPEFIPAMPKT